MALIKCPECHADVSDEAIACPKCGHPIAQKAPKEPEVETILYQGSPVMFRNRPMSFLLCLLLIFVGVGLIMLLLYQGSPVMFRDIPMSFLLSLPLGLIGVGLIILLIWWLMCRNMRLEITNKRTELRTGLLAKNTIELRHKDVRSVVVRQSFVQRILGVGILELSSAAEDDFEIAVSGLRDPQRVAEIIQQHQE